MLKKVILVAMIFTVFSIGTNVNVFGQSIMNESKTMKKEVSTSLVRESNLKNLTASDNGNQLNINEEKDNLKNHNKRKKGMSTKTKVAIGLGIVAAIAVIVIAVSLDNFEEKLF